MTCGRRPEFESGSAGLLHCVSHCKIGSWKMPTSFRCRVKATGVFLLLACLCFHLHVTSAHAPVAFLNGTSLLRLASPLPLRDRISFSFRTCSTGELLSQEGPTGDRLTFTLIEPGSLEVSWFMSGGWRGRAVVGRGLKSNRWENVDLVFARGAIRMQVGNELTTLADANVNSELLSLNLTGARSGPLVGRNFTGCILQGPGVIFQDDSQVIEEEEGVSWGSCPFPDKNGCGGYESGGIHCFVDPCENRGECIPVPDGYYCQCLRRYQGHNCQEDKGDLCGSELNYCQNGGMCREDDTGNDTYCICPPKFTLPYCEQFRGPYVCDDVTCANGGTCNEFANGTYVCMCPPGFAGDQCEKDVDECLSSPCRNGGVCTDGFNSYTCNCTGTGFTGRHCDVDVDECQQLNPCAPGSTCFNRFGDYLCQCPPGIGGKHCDREYGMCQDGRCRNGATCVDAVDGYSCLCQSGFHGRNCEMITDSCADDTCPPNSVCVSGIGNYKCLCLPGFTGGANGCEDVNECLSSPCFHGGTCVDLVNGFSCLCLPGFTGPDCFTSENNCASHPCMNGGACLDGNDSFRCHCVPGFSGEWCEIDVNECDSNPCQNGGTCTDRVNGYNCSCLSGWEGTNCDTERDECASSPCVHGQCTDAFNDYACNCEPGYTGKSCEENVNDCIPNPCQNGGFCVDGVDDFVCKCPPEFMGKNCSQPYDACASSPCRNAATCDTQPPSHEYVCTCPFGFTGTNCEENVDDCVGVVCPQGQVCHDMVGAYNCSCPAGFTGPDCSQEVDACLSSPCAQGATCFNGPGGGFRCECPAGLTGTRCEEDIDECVSAPCQYKSVCVNTPGSFQCYCTPGFTGDFCHIDIDECLSNPCLNGATCLNQVSNYECVCAPGFSGRNCELDVDECASVPCRNGGTCTDLVNGYQCSCTPGFAGRDCEIDVDECGSDPCLNGGKCVDRVNGYECECSGTGYTGARCENVDDCLSQPCLNGATCVDLEGDFSCTCHSGYVGKSCETDVPECALFPCQNGGTCFERSNATLYQIGMFPGESFSYVTAGGYVCKCPDGFAGTDCEINVDDCAENRCVNGTCIDGINGFNCSCFVGFEGVLCDREIDECERFRPCHAGATCEDLVGTYRCVCPANFVGQDCSVELIGCRSEPCGNGATCVPYLRDDGEHAFRCTCPPGFHGTTCEVSSTFTLNGSPVGPLEPAVAPSMQSHPDEAYSLSFEFRTTIANALLASGCDVDHSRCFVAYLKDGAVHLSVSDPSLKSVVRSVKIMGMLSDASWHSVLIRFTGPQVVLNVSGISEKQSLSPLLVASTFLGGHPPNLKEEYPAVAHNSSNFVGCMRSVFLDGELKVPNSGLPGVNEGCTRVEQCRDDSCSRKGDCVDLWMTYECRCRRPRFGNDCTESFTPSTFGYLDAASYASVKLDPSLQSSLVHGVDVSLFLRTRNRSGLLFYLGRDQQQQQEEEEAQHQFMAAVVRDGKLQVVVEVGRAEEEVAVLSVDKQVDDAEEYFVQVSLNSSHLLGLVHDRETVQLFPSGGLLSPQVLFIGGLPPLSMDPTMMTYPQKRKRKRQAEYPGLEVYSLTDVTGFKGIIQDFRLNGIQVSCFPDAVVPEQVVPDECVRVEKGVKSDDPCRSSPCEMGYVCQDDWNAYHCSPKAVSCQRAGSEPCQNGGTCEDTKDGFVCLCLGGFTGDDCSQMVVVDCGSQPCLNGGRCENLPDSYPGSEKYVCHCPSMFVGRNCESFQPCSTNPCIRGNCTPSGTHGGYQCTCEFGFTGRNCSLQAECMASQCENGGRCTQHVEETEEGSELQYACICPEGYAGRFCEDKVDVLTSENLALAIGATLGCLCVVTMLVVLAMFLRIAKKKRATRGTYSPSRQEMYGSRVEMNHVMKPPPEERLI